MHGAMLQASKHQEKTFRCFSRLFFFILILEDQKKAVSTPVERVSTSNELNIYSNFM